jgi:flagellar assembly protein FliH
MSSSAKRVAAEHFVSAFDWSGTSPRETAPRQALPHVADPDSPVVAELRDEHQVHFAALEREAFASGYAAGERAGLEAGNKRAEAMLRRLAQTLDELRSLRGTMIRQTEQQMVQLALAIARRILHREMTVDQDLLVALARVALERLGDSGAATIRLNPEDHAQTVQRHGDHWAGSRVRVIADPGVSRGGCLLESDFGLVDASVEAQFEQVARAFSGEPAVVPTPKRHAA